MTKADSSLYDMSPLKLALASRQMKGTLALMRAEPIAVVGMDCRFPGGSNSPEAYWSMLSKGVDAVGEIPSGRWDVDHYYDPDPKAPGKMYCKYGSFIDDIDRFDAALFGISPREAASMDPQQRILLETAWMAIHHAGLDTDKIYGSNTGVYVGISTYDYAALQLGLQAPERVDPYYVSGTVLSVAAGRLSYALGLKGPSMSLDTACSSSLVAVHQACEALRRQECNLALSGGVGLIIAPEPAISFCKAGLLSPDGRCKTFDDTADGYGRGEGCGVLVLKRLSDALADSDGVLALIRGSCINQDGASGGLTVPSGPSQEMVIRTALSTSGLRPEQVGYVEAHGTGTSLGDPIEMGALQNLFGNLERSTPLYVGSVKTNFGHLEAAAGVAGIIKLILSFQHKTLPGHLHFDTPNSRIDWNDSMIRVSKKSMPWPRVNDRMIAGVSSFGFCGTNAHVVMEGFHVERTSEEMSVKPVTFSKQRFWADTSLSEPPPSKALLLPGKRLNLPFSREIRFECPMGEKTLDHLPDHRLFGHLVVAGASHLSMIVEAVNQAFGPVGFEIKGMTLHAPLVVYEAYETLAQLILSPLEDNLFGFKLVSSVADDVAGGCNSAVWTLHAEGQIHIESSASDFPSADPEAFTGTQELGGDQLYQEITYLGHHLGPSFRWVENVEWHDGEILSRMEVPSGLEDSYRFHPGLLDSCFQFFCIRGPLIIDPENNRQNPHKAIFVPFAFGSIRIPSPFEKNPGPLYSHVRIQSGPGTQPGGISADVTLSDSAGNVMLEMTDYTVRPLSISALNLALASREPPETYEVKWLPETPSQSQGDEISTTNCIILADRRGLGRKMADYLEAHHGHVFLLFAGEIKDQVELPDGTVSSLEKWLMESQQPIDRVFYMWGLDSEVPETPDQFTSLYDKECLSLMHLVRLLVTLKNKTLPKLTLITRAGWNDVKGNQVNCSPFQAMLWGMGRVIQEEYPAFECSLVEWLDDDITSTHMNRVLGGRGGEELMFKRGTCLTPRLVPLEYGQQEVSLNSEKSYLITGGAGDLGMAVAERLVARGAVHLVLTGRTRPGKKAQIKIENLMKKVATIRFIAADMGQEDDVRRLIKSIQQEMPPLAGVVHAAGCVDDALLIHQDRDRMIGVLTPKVAGTWYLYNQTSELDLDFMVFFSSMSALLGNAGQAGYAAANACMDGIAHAARRESRPCLSVNWGGWADLGMASHLNKKERERLVAMGVGLINPDQALDALEQLLAREIPQAAVLNIKWDRYAARYGTGKVPSLITSLIPEAFSGTPEKFKDHDGFVDQLKKLTPDDRKPYLLDYLWKKSATILGLSGEHPQDMETGLFDLGMDSIMALQLKEQLAHVLNHPIQSTLVFNYPTISDIAGYVMTKLIPELFNGFESVEKTDKSRLPLREEINSNRVFTESDLEGLSEENLENMLEDKLAKLDKWSDQK